LVFEGDLILQNDIDLEIKIHSLINRYKLLDRENKKLKAELSKVENVNSELNTKINYAIEQLELFKKEFLVD
jgi:predicted nuclease with TOPRIM domain